MAMAYKCDKCGAYFDGLTSYPHTYTGNGIKIPGNMGFQVRKTWRFDRRYETYLCSTHARELSDMLNEWWFRDDD